MASLSAFTSCGKLPLPFIQQAITGKGWPGTQGAPASLCPEPLHLSVLSLRVLGPPHPEEGEKKRVSIGRGRPNHVRGPGPVGRHHGSAGEVEETALPFLATLQR